MIPLPYNGLKALSRVLIPVLTAVAAALTPWVQAWAAESPLNAAILAAVVAAATAFGVDLDAWKSSNALFGALDQRITALEPKTGEVPEPKVGEVKW